MQAILQMPFPPGLRRMVVSACLIALHCFVIGLSSNASWHEWLHGDAAQPTHECAVTLLQKQQLVSDAPQVELDLPQTTSFQVVAFAEHSVFGTLDYRLLPGRAPPV